MCYDPVTSRRIVEYPIPERDVFASLRNEAQLRPKDIWHGHCNCGGSYKRQTFDGSGLKAILGDVTGNQKCDFCQCFHGRDNCMRVEGRQFEKTIAGGLGSNSGASG